MFEVNYMYIVNVVDDEKQRHIPEMSETSSEAEDTVPPDAEDQREPAKETDGNRTVC